MNESIHSNRYEQDQADLKAAEKLRKLQELDRAKFEMFEKLRAEKEPSRGPVQGSAFSAVDSVAYQDESALRREISYLTRLIRVARLKRERDFLKRELEELQSTDFG